MLLIDVATQTPHRPFTLYALSNTYSIRGLFLPSEVLFLEALLNQTYLKQ